MSVGYKRTLLVKKEAAKIHKIPTTCIFFLIFYAFYQASGYSKKSPACEGTCQPLGHAPCTGVLLATAAAHEDEPFGAALFVRKVDEFGGTSERAGDVVKELPFPHGGKVAGGLADSFEHDGDGAFVGIAVADGQRDALGSIRLFYNQKLPRKRGFGDSGGFN